MPAPNYGRDLWCRKSLVTTRYATGVDLVVNALVRRCTTRKGTLYFHPEYGIDAPGIGDTLDPSMLQALEFKYKSGIESDPRVRSGSVRVNISAVEDPSTLRTDLRIEVTGDSDQGPFEFVVTVDKVTLALLKIEVPS